jgi:DNA (cytosine-5)-methyltransferase 1
MGPETKYSDLPERLRRYRSDIFDDKYKRLEWGRVSRTITAHIAKDGYWYIHPAQDRTLTVREAARIQTFPDHFRFAGTPTAAFRQIGNAVPPYLGRAVGAAVRDALGNPSDTPAPATVVATELATWWRARPSLVSPWLREGTRWQVIVAEHLLDRQSHLVVRFVWPLLRRWKFASDTIKHSDEFLTIARWMGRSRYAQDLLTIAVSLEDRGLSALRSKDLETLVREKVVYPGLADMAVLAGSRREKKDDEEPVVTTHQVLRVVARVEGEHVDRRNQLTDGRLVVARLIGYSDNSRDAHLALVEIGRSICRGADPLCDQCPLRNRCSFALTRISEFDALEIDQQSK